MLPRASRVSSAAVLVEDGKILLCRNSPNALNPGMWTLPGGGVEFGEHPEETLRRELLEETGLIVEPGPILKLDSVVINRAADKLHWLRIIYGATVIGGALRDEREGSTDRCDWFTLREASGMPLVSLAAVSLELVDVLRNSPVRQ